MSNVQFLFFAISFLFLITELKSMVKAIYEIRRTLRETKDEIEKSGHLRSPIGRKL